MKLLPLPDTESGIAKVRCELQRVDYAAPEASGRQGGVQAGWPLWGVEFTIERSDPESGDTWRAFVTRLRGRLRRFLAGDPLHKFPLNYAGGFGGMVKAGGGAFSGSASGWAQALAADGDATITLSGLPAGLALRRGDYIGFKWNAAGSPAGTWDRRTMARLVDPAVASGAGVLAALVEPPIDPRVVPANAVAHLDSPACIMALVPEETKLGAVGAGRAFGGGSIVGIQDLRP